MAFKPKQALAPSPALYKEMTGDAMQNMARVSLKHVEIPPGSVVHDNGCGVGAGSQALLEKQADLTIKATDIDENALKLYHGSGETLRMDSTALTFPDNTFTYSLLNATVFVLPNDGIDGVKEMHRTLQPGGTAIVNSIAYGPNILPIRHTAAKTRPEGTPLPREGSEKWHSSDFLKSVLEQGGFKDVKMSQTSYKTYTKATLDHFATMLWSFVGGTGAAGWLESDEDRWDEAIEILKKELEAAKGIKLVEDGIELEFLLNIATATK
jgi:SAM-dependent methyltransferase